MNIEKAKGIPLPVILEKMGLKPQHSTKNKVCYYSPFRNEKTPSFYHFPKTNTWYDFGDAKWKGGDGVTLVRAWLDSTKQDSEVPDALRWLSMMTNTDPLIKTVSHDETPHDETLVLQFVSSVKNTALIRYAENRGIPFKVVNDYLEEITFFNKKSGKKILALGIENESDGYEVRNPFFKSSLKAKAISIVRGKHPQTRIHIFEGMMDFLSVVTMRNGKHFDDDVILLHSVTNLNKAAEFLKGNIYTDIYTWMDNDQGGNAATEAWKEFCQNHSLKHFPMNQTYKPYKDVNAFHMAKLELV
jgi:hypothetical protein